jgi:hypothetical protein
MPRDDIHLVHEGDVQEPSRKSRLLYCADIDDLPDPDYLVEDLIQISGIYAIYGKPGCKKTFIVLDIAMTIGALSAYEIKQEVKITWHGKEVEHGCVFYVWAEGQSGIRKRMTAWRQHHQRLGQGHSVVVLNKSVNLRDKKDVVALLRDIEEAEESTGLKVKLIVFDTLSRCSGNANINMPGEMAELVTSLERIKAKTSAAILLIHHEGKEASRGMMGATTLQGAVDAEFKVEANGEFLQLTGGKTKDDAEADMTFKTKIIDVVDPRTRKPMLTKKGKKVTTLVVVPLDENEIVEAKEQARSNQKKPPSDEQINALQAFNDWLIDNKGQSMPVETWYQVMKSRGVAKDSNAAHRYKAQLDRRGLLRIENERIFQGKKVDGC